MARNGSGTYSRVNTFIAGATITAAGHNQNWADLENEMTNSVAADGQTTMTGPLKAANGSVAAPSIAFGSDQDTGFYRKSANVMGVVVGGVEVGVIGSTGFVGLGSVPIGARMGFPGATAPSGWIFAYGQAISRTTYADLFAAYGTTHGTGDGSTTFNVPDYRGRVAAGKDDMGGSAASRLTGQSGGVTGSGLGNAGGAETHALTSGQNGQHSHTATDSGHTHTSTNNSSAFFVTGTGSVRNDIAQATVALGNIDSSGQTTGSGTASITVQNSGSGTAHNNVQPTIIENVIIFTGVA
jgi:microcystin-dependent protein